MNSDLYFEGKRYISSSRAAKISGYVNDYIGQLCRDGKLECKMVGRSWYVALDSLVQHKNQNGIGTRSRGPQKIAEDHARPILGDLKESEVALFVPSSATLNFGKNLGGQVPPQAVATTLGSQATKIIRPVSYPFGTWVSKSFLPSPLSRRRSVSDVMVPFARFSLASFALLLALLGFRFGLSVSPVSHEIYSGAFQGVSKNMQASAFGGAGQTFDHVAVVWHDTLERWFFNTRQTFYVMTGKNFAQNIVQPVAPKQLSTSLSQGMVVVPINQNTNQDVVVARVKKSFSDEVSVNPARDGESGVITPVFKKTKGDEYLYVLVPIKN